MKSSMMSDQLRQLGFRNFVSEGRPKCVREARDCAWDYLERFQEIRSNRQNSIALLGVPGAGKTHLLVAVANNLFKHGVAVLYFPHVEGFDDIKDNLDEKEAKISTMKTVDVLLWDDLFKGRTEPTEWQKETIFGVINYRYLHNKPIMISSERSIDQICDIDLGIGSRIYEMTKNHTVLLLPDKEAGVKELNYRLRGA